MLISCTGSKELSKDEFRDSDKKPTEITAAINDYSTSLKTISGKARAIVSEPENSERVNLTFSSNRKKSLVTIRNNLGMEGGELLTDGDTLLVYNKVDKYVRKIPVQEGRLNRINRLASLNILQIINFETSAEQVSNVSENEYVYRLEMADGTVLYVDKDQMQIREVRQPQNSMLPYSRILYEGYGELEGFVLPRRISIFSSDGESKIALQIRSLQINPGLDSLIVNYPDDIPIYYQ